MPPHIRPRAGPTRCRFRPGRGRACEVAEAGIDTQEATNRRGIINRRRDRLILLLQCSNQITGQGLRWTTSGRGAGRRTWVEIRSMTLTGLRGQTRATRAVTMAGGRAEEITDRHRFRWEGEALMGGAEEEGCPEIGSTRTEAVGSMRMKGGGCRGRLIGRTTWSGKRCKRRLLAT